MVAQGNQGQANPAIAVRTNFNPLAAWSPEVTTGADGKAALDRAFALLAGTPDAPRIEEAKTYLAIARASDEINVRTMAENLLRTLDPQLTAAAETTP